MRKLRCVVSHSPPPARSVSAATVSPFSSSPLLSPMVCTVFVDNKLFSLFYYWIQLVSLHLQGRRAQSHRCVNRAAAVPCVSSNRHNNFWKRHCDNIEKTSLGIFSHWKQREKKIVFFTTREGELRRSLRQSCSLRWEGCEMSSRGSSSRLTSTLLEPWIWILLKSFAAQSYNFKQAYTIVQKLIRFFLLSFFFSRRVGESQNRFLLHCSAPPFLLFSVFVVLQTLTHSHATLFHCGYLNPSSHIRECVYFSRPKKHPELLCAASPGSCWNSPLAHTLSGSGWEELPLLCIWGE